MGREFNKKWLQLDVDIKNCSIYMIFLSVCTKVIFLLLFILFRAFSKFSAIVTPLDTDLWPDPWIQSNHDRIFFPLLLLEGEWLWWSVRLHKKATITSPACAPIYCAQGVRLTLKMLTLSTVQTSGSFGSV